jgi:trimeric autotransporter adhesin
VEVRGRTGSNNLIVGSDGGWTGYGDLIAGLSNQATNRYSAVFGQTNIARGSGELLGGLDNSAFGQDASATGGQSNDAGGSASSVSGGELNYSQGIGASVTGGCQNDAGLAPVINGSCPSSGLESVTGGEHSGAFGTASSDSGGYDNVAYGTSDSILGGKRELLGLNAGSSNDYFSQAGPTVFGP